MKAAIAIVGFCWRGHRASWDFLSILSVYRWVGIVTTVGVWAFGHSIAISLFNLRVSVFFKTPNRSAHWTWVDLRWSLHPREQRFEATSHPSSGDGSYVSSMYFNYCKPSRIIHVYYFFSFNESEVLYTKGVLIFIELLWVLEHFFHSSSAINKNP